jgi:hypothetical protein
MLRRLPAPSRSLATRLVPCLLLLGLAVALPAFAYPSQITAILRQSGTSGVVRAPGTVNDEVKKDLDQLAQDTAAKTGAKVYLVVVKSTDNPNEYVGIYNDLNMAGKDMLIVTNGPAWDLRCNALSAAEKDGILSRAGMTGSKPLERMHQVTDQVASSLANTRNAVASTGARMSWQQFEHANAGKGWSSAQMSAAWAQYKQGLPHQGSTRNSGGDNTALATSTAELPPLTKTHSSGPGAMLYVLLAFVAAIGGWVFFRRRNRDASLAEDMKRALQGPEAAMTDVYMDLDDKHPRFVTLIEEATAVTGRIDAIKRAPPSRESIARLSGLQDEARRLRQAVGKRN